MSRLMRLTPLLIPSTPPPSYTFIDNFNRVDGTLVGSTSNTGQIWGTRYPTEPSPIISNGKMALNVNVMNAFVDIGATNPYISIDIENNINDLRFNFSNSSTEVIRTYYNVRILEYQVMLRKIVNSTIQDSVTYTSPVSLANCNLVFKSIKYPTTNECFVYINNNLILSQNYKTSAHPAGPYFMLTHIHTNDTTNIDNIFAREA